MERDLFCTGEINHIYSWETGLLEVVVLDVLFILLKLGCVQEIIKTGEENSSRRDQ